MEKKIIEELYRIKNLMGYDRSNPNKSIIKEQGSATAALASSDQGVEVGVPVSGAFAKKGQGKNVATKTGEKLGFKTVERPKRPSNTKMFTYLDEKK